MIKADSSRASHLNPSPLRGSYAFENALVVSSKNMNLNVSNQVNYQYNSKQNSFSQIGQMQVKRTPIINARENETTNRRSGSVPRSGGAKNIVDQRAKVLSNAVQNPHFHVSNGLATPNNRMDREVPKKRSISTSKHGSPDPRSRSYGPVEEEFDTRAKASNESSYYLHSQSKGKNTGDSDEFPKIELSPLRAAKNVTDSSQSSGQYSNAEKLPSVEDKKKRVSALESYVKRVYGDQTGKINSNLAPEERRVESQDRGGNLRKKLYSTRGTGNQSVVSDALNSTTNVKSFEKDTSFNDNTEPSEKEMNPEDIHYFFVSNIQKSRQILSQAEK